MGGVVATQLVTKMVADTSGVEQGIQKVKQDSEDGGQSVGGLLGKLAGFAVAGIGIATVAGYFKGAIDGAMAMEVAQANTNRILSSGSHVAGLTAQAVENLSQKLMAQTGVDDDVVRGAENILAGYSHISNKAYPDVAKAALDMARAQSMATGSAFDANGAAKALGMALQDPAKAARLLRGENILLSDSQQKAIATALKHHDTAKADAEIMDAVKSKVNGASEAYKNTASGGMMAFNTSMGNIQKTIGAALLPMLTNLLNKVLPVAAVFAQNLPGAIANAEAALVRVQQAIAGVIEYLQTHEDAMMAVKALLLGLAAGAAVFGTSVLVTVIPAFVGWAIAAGTAAIATIAATLPILAVIAAVALLAFGIMELIKHWADVQKFFGNIKQAVGDFVGNIGNAIGSFLGNAGQAIATAMGNLGKTIDSALASIISTVQSWGKQALDALTWPYRTAYTLTLEAFASIKQAINDAIQFILGLFQWLYQHNTYFGDMVKGWKIIIADVQGFIQTAFDTIKSLIVDAIDYVKGVVQTDLELIQTYIVEPLQHAWTWIQGVFGALSKWFNDRLTETDQAVEDKVTAIAQTVISALQRAWSFIQGVFGAIGTWFSDRFNDAVNAAKQGWDRFVALVATAKDVLAQKLDQIKHAILDPILNLGNEMLDAGKNLINMLIKGIQNTLGNLKGVLGNVAGSIAGFLGFHSPTEEGPGRDADTWMPNLGNMLAQGLLGQKGALGDAAGAVAGSVRAQLAGLAASPQVSAAFNATVANGLVPTTLPQVGGGAAAVSLAQAQSQNGATQLITIQLDSQVLTSQVLKGMPQQVRLATGKRI